MLTATVMAFYNDELGKMIVLRIYSPDHEQWRHCGSWWLPPLIIQLWRWRSRATARLRWAMPAGKFYWVGSWTDFGCIGFENFIMEFTHAPWNNGPTLDCTINTSR